jgi:Flp pilus assembly protein TadD
MTRILGGISAAALAFALAACGGSGSDDEPSESILTGVPAPEESILTGVPAPSE